MDDQEKQMLSWFLGWNQCDQTSALCSLLNNVSAAQMKFIGLVLDQKLTSGRYDLQELARMESDANNPAFLSSLHNETEDVALQYLLSHILLLQPGNSQARGEYLKLITKVFFGSEDEEYLYQCRQLLSFTLNHPAFPLEDREKINFWYTTLEEKRRKIIKRVMNDQSRPSSRNPYVNITQRMSLPRNASPQSSPIKKVYQVKTSSTDDDKANTLNGSNRIYITIPSSSSGLPPTTDFKLFDTVGEIPTYPSDNDQGSVRKGFNGNNVENCHTPDSMKDYGYMYKKKNQRKSVTLPLPRPSSVCSMPASLDEPGFLKAGMKDVPSWLRNLRLHKYQNLFADMSYEELLATTEEFLESKEVTKGARNKILQNIKNLHRRQEILAEIDQELKKPGNLLLCIKELEKVLHTPFKPYQHSTDDKSTITSAQSNTCSEEEVKDGTEQKGNNLSSCNDQTSSPQRNPTSDNGSSSGDSSCSSPPSSPRLNRSSSSSSIDELISKTFPSEDLPSLILKGLGKVFNQLMMHTETNEENLTAFIEILDIAMCHEGFKVKHKGMFFGWKQQCQQTLLVISPRKPTRNRGWSNSYTISGPPSHPNVTSERSRNNRRVNGRNVGQGPKIGYTSLLGSPRSVSTLPRALPRQIQQPLPPPYYPPRSRASSLNSTPIPVPVQARNHRYVNLPVTSHLEVNEMFMEETHELCKSVTEHALQDQ